MYIPLMFKTDYSLLKSLCKIDDIIAFLTKNNIKYCGICDDNLSSSMEFYDKCLKNDIKPIIGLDVILNNEHVILYAINYVGYKNLLKINSIINKRPLAIKDIELYKNNIVAVIPFVSNSIFSLISKYLKTYIAYKTELEKNNALIITNNIIFNNYILAITNTEIPYLNYLDMIKEGSSVSAYTKKDFSSFYYLKDYSTEDINSIIDFVKEIDIVIPKDKKYIPSFDTKNHDPYEYLISLAKKGLNKRLNNNVSDKYINRLKHELTVINKMGFVDYFLIVYDYVKYAKTHDILVGPGRGSAAGSLVSYSLGITNIDPLKYDLLFERFLNEERVTMPDIDIDFEFDKRYLVINYVKEKYGLNNVANIITYGTLASKQVLRDVAKCLELSQMETDSFVKLINPKLSLKDNYKNKQVETYIKINSKYKELYNIASHLEGIKRHTSTHAAGIVISSVRLDEVIPITYEDESLLTGVTMEYLEELGLLKMDFLGITNLSIISNVLALIKESGNELDLNKIPLDDKETIDIFNKGDTLGIFQFESSGMISFLKRLKSTSFDDLVSALALYRPGPMDNIDEYIKRKEGSKKISYLTPSLEPILKSTYGIIIYQEQIMQILVTMAGYKYSEADNIRRAMSKKKKEVMEKEQVNFIKRSVNLGYSEDLAKEVYDLILKFANYGFNKSHSVAYAYLSYQMAYLKAHYLKFYITNILNMNIGSAIKTKEYISLAKRSGITILEPNVNNSSDIYKIVDNKIIMPLTCIKNIGREAVDSIIKNRGDGYKDYLDFVALNYGKSVNKKTLEALISSGALKCFGYNNHSLDESIDIVINYASLVSELDASLVMKPEIPKLNEYDKSVLISRELETYGYYVSNHPASSYINNVIKASMIKDYFDKSVLTVVLVESIRSVQTKKKETMAFLTCSDETGEIDYVIFPKNNRYLETLKKGMLIKVKGLVSKRFLKYQIVVSNIEIIK